MIDRAYQHPPIVLAVLEVRHLETAAVPADDVAEFRRLLKPVAPLYKTDVVTHTDLQVLVTPDGATSPAVQTNSQTVHRVYSRTREIAVTIGPGSLTVETCRYAGWDPLVEAVRLALRARLGRVDGVERIGLRYFDEIRIPRQEDPDWGRWVSPGLLAPRWVSPWPLLQQQSVAHYAVNDGLDDLTFRYGAVNGPSTFQSRPHLARPDPGVGPYFLLDTDASWRPKAGEPCPEPDIGEILAIATRLHGAATAVFESSITDALRQEVLNHA